MAMTVKAQHLLLFFQGFTFTNTSPLAAPTGAKEVSNDLCYTLCS